MADEPQSPPSDPSGSPRPPIQPGKMPPPPPPPAGYGYYPPPPPAKKSGGAITRILGGLLVSLLLVSIVVNVYLALTVAALTGGPTEKPYQSGDSEKRVVILPVKGVIDDAMFQFVRESLSTLEEDPPAALVLRVESGGGGVTASDQIFYALDSFKKKYNVPIVASFGNVAASGGYYIACAADHIVIEETGITGSIGVMAQVPTVEGLLNKVGVEMHVIVADGSPRKDVANNIYEHWEPGDENEQVFKRLLDTAYERFVKVVVQGRPSLDEPTVTKLADGSVYTAEEANTNGLVDQVGYLDEAITKAAQLAQITGTPKVTQIRQPQSFGSLLGVSKSEDTLLSMGPKQLRGVIDELGQARLMYLSAWR